MDVYVAFMSRQETEGRMPPGSFSYEPLRKGDRPLYWGQFPVQFFYLIRDITANKRFLFHELRPREKVARLIDFTRATYTFDTGSKVPYEQAVRLSQEFSADDVLVEENSLFLAEEFQAAVETVSYG
jgi:hypothetical protein